MVRQFFIAVFIGSLATATVAGELAKGFTGRVVDEKGQALAGAKVVAIGLFASTQYPVYQEGASTTTTGADGVFRLPPLPPALFIVAVKEGKCIDWVNCFSVQSGVLTLRLGPAATIDGQIVDDLGKPVVGASVSLLLQMQYPSPKETRSSIDAEPFRTKTDNRGRFRFTNIPKGAEVGFDMTAPGYARALADGHFVPGQKGLRFVLPPEGRLKGTVVEKATGKPLADVSVHAVGSLTSDIHQASAKTDKEGQFTIHGLTAGKYDIEITGTGLALPEWIGSQKKVLVENGKVASAKIDAVRGGTLEIVLTDLATSKPLAAAAFVTVCPAEDLRICNSGLASKDGVARLYLSAGKYVIPNITVAGYTYKQEKGKSFTVETGKTKRAIVALSVTPQVALTVRDSSGKAVAGAKAQLLPFFGMPKNMVAGKDGRLAVSADDIGPMFCFIIVRHPRQNLSALVFLGKGEKPPQIMLSPPIKASGVVADGQGRPMGGVVVQAQVYIPHIGRSAVIATAQTDKEGRYQMELPSTNIISYVISARVPGCSVAEMVIGPTQLAQGKGKLKALVLNDRKVRGVVKNAQGKPVAGAIVNAKAMGGPSFPGSAVTDVKGQFTLKHLGDNPVIYVFARVPGRGWIGDSTIKPSDKELTIRVAPSRWD